MKSAAFDPVVRKTLLIAAVGLGFSTNVLSAMDDPAFVGYGGMAMGQQDALAAASIFDDAPGHISSLAGGQCTRTMPRTSR